MRLSQSISKASIDNSIISIKNDSIAHGSVILDKKPELLGQMRSSSQPKIERGIT